MASKVTTKFSRHTKDNTSVYQEPVGTMEEQSQEIKAVSKSSIKTSLAALRKVEKISQQALDLAQESAGIAQEAVARAEEIERV